MSKQADTSAQAIIRQFLQSNLPSFQSISDIDPDWSAEDLDEPKPSSPSIAAGDDASPSVSLSLPDSFDQVATQTAEQFRMQIKQAQSQPKATVNAGGTNVPPRPHCIQCLEIKRWHTARYDKLEDETTEMRRELLIATQEVQQARRLSGLTTDGLKQELATSEERCTRLAAALETESRLRSNLEDSARRSIGAEQKIHELEAQITILKSSLDTSQKTLHNLERSANLDKDLQQRIYLLEKDKQHLATSLQRSEQAAEHLEHQLDTERRRSQQLELKLTQLTTNNDSQTNPSALLQQQFDNEIRRIREMTAQEIHDLRISSREFAEREATILREARQASELELHTTRQRLREVEEELKESREKMQSALTSKVAENNELRIELRCKTTELTSLRAITEEKSLQLKNMSLGYDKVLAELQVHRIAVDRLEQELCNKEKQYRDVIDDKDRQLAAYHTLEVEVDHAVLRVAKKSSPNRESEEVEVVKGIPTSPERRVRQAIFLAQRLLATEQERDDALKECTFLKGEVDKAVKEQKKCLEQVELAAQPTVYLVNKVRSLEVQAIEHEQRALNLQMKLEKEKKKRCEADNECEMLRERLEVVLMKRGELETVKAMLEHLHLMEMEAQESASSSDDEEEEEENDEMDKRRRLLEEWRGEPDDRGEIEMEVASGRSYGGGSYGSGSNNNYSSSAAMVDRVKLLGANHLGLQPSIVQEIIQPYYRQAHPGLMTSSGGEDAVPEHKMAIDNEQDPEIIPLGFSSAR